MKNLFEIVIGLIAAAVLGMMAGSDLNTSAITKDCETIGAFRDGNTVYLCRKTGG